MDAILCNHAMIHLRLVPSQAEPPSAETPPKAEQASKRPARCPRQPSWVRAPGLDGWTPHPKVCGDLFKPLAPVLVEALQMFEGDLRKFLILLVVVLRTGEHPDYRAMSHDEIRHGEIEHLPSRGTNGRSIAASLEMPIESVRRKIHELIDDGWIIRRGRNLFITGKAYREIAILQAAVGPMAIEYAKVARSLTGAGD